MEFFIDGWCVRLRSRRHGTYLHASDDGVGVSMRPERASLNAAWMVERVQRGGASYALLRGAAYGRYLAVKPAQPGLLRPRLLVQRVYDHPEQDDVLWEVFNAGEPGGDVFIRHSRGRRQPPWYFYLGVRVTEGNYVYVYDDPAPSMHWMVDVLVPRLQPPALPPPPPPPPPLPGVLQRPFSRLIGYVLGNNLGNFAQDDWQAWLFLGRSVYELRSELAGQLKFENPNDITVCVKAGSQGRLTHLVVDLPANANSMNIVVLRTDSTENLRSWLWHPDVDRV